MTAEVMDPMDVPGLRAFALQLSSGLVPADLEAVRVEIGDRLDLYEPVLAQAEAGFQTVVDDCRGRPLAVLLAIAAVTGFATC